MYNPFAIRIGQTVPSRGYNGPGIYRVTSPIGLTLHQGTSRKSFGYGVTRQGWDFEVIRDAGNGWFEGRGDIDWFKWENPPSGIPQQRRDNPETKGYVTGYVCGSCSEHAVGPGPWLIALAPRTPAPAPYIPQYRVPVSYAVPGSLPTSRLARAGTSFGQIRDITANRFNRRPITESSPSFFVRPIADSPPFAPISRAGGIETLPAYAQRLIESVWNDRNSLTHLSYLYKLSLMRAQESRDPSVRPENVNRLLTAINQMMTRVQSLPVNYGSFGEPPPSSDGFGHLLYGIW